MNNMAVSPMINRIISESNVGLLNKKNGKETLVSLHFMYFEVNTNNLKTLDEYNLFFDNAEIRLMRNYDIETFTILNTHINDMKGMPCFKFSDMMIAENYSIQPAHTVSQIVNEFKLELKHDIFRS